MVVVVIVSCDLLYRKLLSCLWYFLHTVATIRSNGPWKVERKWTEIKDEIDGRKKWRKGAGTFCVHGGVIKDQSIVVAAAP